MIEQWERKPAANCKKIRYDTPTAILDNWRISILWTDSDNYQSFGHLGNILRIKYPRFPSAIQNYSPIKDVLERYKQLTDSPIFSPLSAATLSETAIADIRLGWVQIILQLAPRAASISDSSMYCGSCVVLPQPVSPETTTTCSIKKEVLPLKYPTEWIKKIHYINGQVSINFIGGKFIEKQRS
jgi:hypothetical protein